MERLEDALARARAIDVDELAGAIQAIGFECTRCGRCCTAEAREPHTATIFPDEIRAIAERTGVSWEEVARPMPYGLDEKGDGETLEWALQTDERGDCRFLETTDDGETACSVYDDRPLICRTYPFSVSLDQSDGNGPDVVATEGILQAHSCPGLDCDTDDAVASALAGTLRVRAIREMEEAIALRDEYRPARGTSPLVVHDSEGQKRPDGTFVPEKDGSGE